MTPQPTTPEIHHFFELLYADVNDGWLVLSRPDPTHITPQGKPALRSHWCNLATTPWHTIVSMVDRLAACHTIYFGVCVQHPTREPLPYRRGWNSTAYIVPGLWFDLDLASGAHTASALPQTEAEGLDFLRSLPTLPSLIVHTGGGIHAYWLFREPSILTTPAEHETLAQLAKRFTHTLVTAGNARGWTLDALGDLARVLRPAGTINHKYGRQVVMLHEGHERYNPSDFDDWLLDLPVLARTTHAGTGMAGQPDLGAVAEHYGTSLERKSQTELAGAHPQHGSSTGDNFNVNVDKGLWHCWRHGTGGDALALIAVCEGLVPCEDMRAGALRGDVFTRTVMMGFQEQAAENVR